MDRENSPRHQLQLKVKTCIDCLLAKLLCPLPLCQSWCNIHVRLSSRRSWSTLLHYHTIGSSLQVRERWYLHILLAHVPGGREQEQNDLQRCSYECNFAWQCTIHRSMDSWEHFKVIYLCVTNRGRQYS